MLDAKSAILAAVPSAEIITIEMDLKSFDSVRKAAQTIRKKIDSINILILNAGAFGLPFELIEGFEVLQVVNHFSHFLLVNSVFDMLDFDHPAPPRVVAVSSEAYKASRRDCRYWTKYESLESAETLANDQSFRGTLQFKTNTRYSNSL